jgi:nicotinamide-nucleotide amidase
MEILARQLGERLLAKGLMLTTAESCTGGWLAQALTSVPGSSRWFERGFVTYSNEAKKEMLGVTAETLARFGAVSRETAEEMARGALRHSHAQVSVAITGIAGPDGGTAEKPVGTVWLAWAGCGKSVSAVLKHYYGDREAVRRQAVITALEGLLDRLSDEQ